ncbi:unnamed protein product, partial [Staurois parvus]
MKGTRGISWGPLLTPGPRAVLEFPNGQSAPGPINNKDGPDESHHPHHLVKCAESGVIHS